MRHQIDLTFVTNMVGMLRAEVDGAILVCDDDEEARFYERFVHPDGRVIPTPGMALQVLGVAEARGVRGIAAAVRGPYRTAHDAPNVFRPGAGDIAGLILRSAVFERVITDIVGNPWLRACEKEVGSIRNRVAWIASQANELRNVCERATGNQLTIGNLADFVDWSAVRIAWDAFGPILLGQGLTQADVTAAQQIAYEPESPEHLRSCDGVEVLMLLAEATRLFRPRGVSPYRSAKVQEFSSLLRVAFDLRELVSCPGDNVIDPDPSDNHGTDRGGAGNHRGTAERVKQAGVVAHIASG